MAIMENFPTLVFPYRVKLLFPYELKDEQILKENLSHIYNDLKEVIEELELLKNNKRVLSFLKFDSQKEKQLKYIEENNRKISEINERMNKDISPYYWDVLKNFDDYIYGKYIKADYLLILQKK